MSDAADKRKRTLEHEHQPRTLQVAGEIEARVSRQDERQLTEAVRNRERESARVEIREHVADMHRSLELLSRRLRAAEVGSQRDAMRSINRGLRWLSEAVDSG